LRNGKDAGNPLLLKGWLSKAKGLAMCESCPTMLAAERREQCLLKWFRLAIDPSGPPATEAGVAALKAS